jgi:Tfp pilus assembly protein PilF
LPVLELRAPLSIYADTTEQNLAALVSVASKPERLATAEQHRHRGEALLAAEAFNAAMKEFRAAIALDDMDSVAWKGLAETARGVDHAELDAFFQSALREHPLNIARLTAAGFYSQQGQYQKAVGLLDAVVETDPNNIEALERLADALAEQGNTRLAGTAERLLQLSPDNAIGLYHLATIRLYESRFDEAIQAAKRSLDHDPKSNRARNVLAIAYERTFQPDLAEAEFRRAIGDASEDSVACNNYGIFLLGRNRTADALQQFKRAIRLNPENVQGFLGMSDALRRAGKNSEADKWHEKAVRLERKIGS